jgi:hypothetical protein
LREGGGEGERGGDDSGGTHGSEWNGACITWIIVALTSVDTP